MSAITVILNRAQQGDPHAADELLPLVYDELRKLAAHKMANEAAGHTLQPTTLLRIDEALEKLAREDPPSAEPFKLRFFAGLTTEQAAALGISERTARRYWLFARAWLHDELQLSSGR
jgi:hypothetical protein